MMCAVEELEKVAALCGRISPLADKATATRTRLVAELHRAQSPPSVSATSIV